MTPTGLDPLITSRTKGTICAFPLSFGTYRAPRDDQAIEIRCRNFAHRLVDFVATSWAEVAIVCFRREIHLKPGRLAFAGSHPEQALLGCMVGFIKRAIDKTPHMSSHRGAS